MEESDLYLQEKEQKKKGREMKRRDRIVELKSKSLL